MNSNLLENTILGTIAQFGMDGESGLTAATGHGLKAEDFNDPVSQSVYKKLTRIVKNNPQLTPHAILVELNPTEVARFGDVFTEGLGVTTQNLGYYIKALKMQTWRAQTIDALSDLCKNGAVDFDPFEDETPLLGKINTAFADITISCPTKRKDKTGTEILTEISNEVEHAQSQATPSLPGVPTGLSVLDRLILGFWPGSLSTVAAYTGMGKSTFLINCMINAAKAGHVVTYYTIEMTQKELYQKILSHFSGLPVNKIRSGQMDDRELDLFAAAIRSASSIEQYLDIRDVTNDYDKLKTDLLATAAKGDTECVMIDYVGLLRITGTYKKRHEELEIITSDLKNIAKKMDIPIVIAAQLNRTVEEGGGKLSMPSLAALKDSSAIAQDSNVVLFLHTNDRYERKDYKIIIGKNREGQEGVLSIKADLAKNKFEG